MLRRSELNRRGRILCPFKEKGAVTETGTFPVKTQGAVPAQPPPLQPPKDEPEAAVAVRVTTVPVEKVAEHVPGQEMPAGELVTVPDPEPLMVTVTEEPAAGAPHASLE